MATSLWILAYPWKREIIDTLRHGKGTRLARSRNHEHSGPKRRARQRTSDDQVSPDMSQPNHSAGVRHDARPANSHRASQNTQPCYTFAICRKADYSPVNPFVFIVGCPRSGTTLLQRMVDAHSQIAIVPETHWIARWFEKRKGLTPEGFVRAKLIPKLLKNRRFAQ